MAGNRDDRYRDDDDQDDLENDGSWEDPSISRYSRDLVPYEDSQELSAYAADEDLDWDDEDDDWEDQQPEVLVIPGAGLPVRTPMARRRRPLTMQVLVATTLACVLLTSAFAFGPLSDTQVNGNVVFDTLTQAVVWTKLPYILYRARPGDSWESIAADYKVTIGGIQLLNSLSAIDEVQVGRIYKIPTDPAYGASYQAKLPAGMYEAGGGLTATNYVGPCMFCSHGGLLNDNGAASCDPNYILGGIVNNNIQSGDASKFGLVNPDPNSRWVRGFTYFHDGVDISTGTLGTPEVAAQSGEVIFSGWDQYGSGFALKINLCGGMAVSYSHMIAPPIVKVGDYVKVGQVVGYQGNTGESFGTHLHFMLWWANIPIDPLCGYPQSGLGGYNSTYHYGGCPPYITKTVWNP